jgi:hypothetical protein
MHTSFYLLLPQKHHLIICDTLHFVSCKEELTCKLQFIVFLIFFKESWIFRRIVILKLYLESTGTHQQREIAPTMMTVRELLLKVWVSVAKFISVLFMKINLGKA